MFVVYKKKGKEKSERIRLDVLKEISFLTVMIMNLDRRRNLKLKRIREKYVQCVRTVGNFISGESFELILLYK